MAQRGSKVVLALVLVTTMWAYSSAQLNCQPPAISLQPCMGFITSNFAAPSPQCCTQLANLVQFQAQCLCGFLNAAPQFPLPVNRTQAINLPGACNIQVPPLSQCNVPSAGASIPAAGSPQAAPGPAADVPLAPGGMSPPSPSTPSPTGVPTAEGGSKAGPTKGQSSSARSSAIFTPSLFLFLILGASVLSSF